MKNEAKEGNGGENGEIKPDHTQSLIIPGVNVQHGLSMTGGTMTLYREVLHLFRKDAEDRLPMLQIAPEAEALPAFVTQVHALKSASSSLGAAEISAEAKALEAAGKAGDFTAIKENLPAFAKHLSELVKNIDAALEAAKNDQIDETAGGFSALLPLFQELESALKTENDSEIDRILDDLNAKQPDSKTKEILDQIAELVLMSEFDNAILTLDSLLNGRG